MTRATGVVALLLLTGIMVLGVLGPMRMSIGARWPRFAIDTLHRDLSLLAIALIAIHVITSVLDGFAPIGLIDAIVPFVSPYRPLWLGLGAVAFDLMLALALTSLVRRRLGYRVWRAIHWLAYASWPVAVLHGLGTGSDTKQGWALIVTFACVVIVAVAVLARIARTDAVPEAWRSPSIVATIGAPLALAAFALVGPLAPGWAKRSGTPVSLLVPHVATAIPVVAHTQPLKLPFTAQLSGTEQQTPADGGAVVDLELRFSGSDSGTLRIRLAGTPDGDGLSMTGSQVDLVAPGLPSAMQGRITQLSGDLLSARLTGASEPPLELSASLQIDGQTGSVTGSLRGRTAG